jgi:hypothetical protein
MNLILGLVYAICAHILTFIQYQGPLKYKWMNDNKIISLFIFGVPAMLLTLESVRLIVTYFGFQLWPARLIGFASGMIVFTFMSMWLFSEVMTLKTVITLILAVAMICIQLFW